MIYMPHNSQNCLSSDMAAYAKNRKHACHSPGILAGCLCHPQICCGRAKYEMNIQLYWQCLTSSMVTMHVQRQCGNNNTVAGHQSDIHAQGAKPCFQAHQQDHMLDDDEDDDGPEEEEEASEPEMRVAKRKRVPVPRPSAGTLVKPESLEEVEQRLQPGSVKHAIFQVHDSPACALLNPLPLIPSGQLFKAAVRAQGCQTVCQGHTISLCFWFNFIARCCRHAYSSGTNAAWKSGNNTANPHGSAWLHRSKEPANS